MQNPIKQIGIVGGGKMGTSIFNLLSQFHFPILWYMRSGAEKAQNKEFRKLKRQLKNNIITQNEFIKFSESHRITDYIQDLSTCDLIIESITEEVEDKKKLINHLFSISQHNTIITSNTSSIPIEKLVDKKYAKRFLGLHFFFPVELKQTVEIISNKYTDSNVVKEVNICLKSIHKKSVLLGKDDAFLLNRLMLMFQAQCFNICHKGNYTFEQLDWVVKEHLFSPGVFSTMDIIGLDLILKSSINYLDYLSDTFVYLPLIEFLKEKVKLGEFGHKSGCGFLKYGIADDAAFDKKLSDEILDLLLKAYHKAITWAMGISNIPRQELELAMNDYLGSETQQWKKITSYE